MAGADRAGTLVTPSTVERLLRELGLADYAMIQQAVVVITLIVVLVVTLLADLLSASLDPRIRDQSLVAA